jgi:phasin family protein
MATTQTKKPGNTQQNWGDSDNKSSNYSNYWGNHNWNNWNQFPNQFFDYNNIRNTTSKNMKAFSDANQVMLEGLQAIARRTNDVLQQNAQQSMECLKETMGCRSLPEAQNKHATLYNTLTQNCFNNAKEVTEIASKATVEVVDICNRRASEASEELANCCATGTCG